MGIHTRAHLGHGPRDPEALPRLPRRQPSKLPLQILSLIGRGHPRVQHHSRRLLTPRHVDQNHAGCGLTRRHRQLDVAAQSQRSCYSRPAGVVVLPITAGSKWALTAASVIGKMLMACSNQRACTPARVLGNTGVVAAPDG
jgi:hypothetical protein